MSDLGFADTPGAITSYVFFSWQSDLPGPVCRSLIERCLEAAVRTLHANAAIELAERVTVLSGTKGKAETVPLADTISRGSMVPALW